MNLTVLKRERAKIEAQKIIKSELKDLIIIELKKEIKAEVLRESKVAKINFIKNSEI